MILVFWNDSDSANDKSQLREVTRQNRACYKDDVESQWKNLKFDPRPSENAWTDGYLNWQKFQLKEIQHEGYYDTNYDADITELDDASINIDVMLSVDLKE